MYTEYTFKITVLKEHDDDIHDAAEAIYNDPDTFLVSWQDLTEEQLVNGK